jgi:YbbR domain-containing protein
MNKVITRNLLSKLASLLIAALLWIFVINTQNPIQPQEIKDVPVTIKGLSDLEALGFVVQDEDALLNQTVRVVVKGKRLQIETLLQNRGLMNVKLDLTPYTSTLANDVDSTERIIAFNVEMSASLDGIVVEDIRPKTIYVTFEKQKVVNKRIEHTITGNINNGYMALEPILKTKSIEIRGPKSEVEKVNKVFVEINVDDFSEDILSTKAPIQVVDVEGKPVTGLKLSQESVEVTLPIGKKRVVPLQAQFTGDLPEGYIQSNTIITPKEITIVGKEDLVDSIQAIDLEPIRLDNVIQSSTFKVDFILPDGIKYIDNMDDKAVVTIEIQKQNSFEYQIEVGKLDINVVGLKEGYTLKFLEEFVPLVLSGSAEELLTFSPNYLRATLDVTDLEEGEYAIPLDLDIKESLKIANKPIALSVKIVPLQEGIEDISENEKNEEFQETEKSNE